MCQCLRRCVLSKGQCDCAGSLAGAVTVTVAVAVLGAFSFFAAFVRQARVRNARSVAPLTHQDAV